MAIGLLLWGGASALLGALVLYTSVADIRAGVSISLEDLIWALVLLLGGLLISTLAILQLTR